MTKKNVPGPLAGIRVLEFTQIIAGPLGGQHLADMGADVIKVEPPEGEPWRATLQFAPGESKTFHALNRGKRSLVIDLGKPEARRVIERLVPTIDVVVINYRPGVAERLGIDYESLRRFREDLIYVESSSFGRHGDWAGKGGYDIVAQAVGGLIGAAARFDTHGTPVLMAAGMPILDFATGYAIAMAVLAALFHRAATGEGQFVETSLLQNALVLQNMQFSSSPLTDPTGREQFLEQLKQARAQGLGVRPVMEKRRAAYEEGQVANIYYRVFYTADGAIAIGNLSLALRPKFRAALGIESDPRDEDPNYDPLSEEARAFALKLRDQVEATFARHPTSYWSDYLDSKGIPNGAVIFVEELLDHPQVTANSYQFTLEHETLGSGEIQGRPRSPCRAPRSRPFGRRHRWAITATKSSPRRSSLQARSKRSGPATSSSDAPPAGVWWRPPTGRPPWHQRQRVAFGAPRPIAASSETIRPLLPPGVEAPGGAAALRPDYRGTGERVDAGQRARPGRGGRCAPPVGSVSSLLPQPLRFSLQFRVLFA